MTRYLPGREPQLSGSYDVTIPATVPTLTRCNDPTYELSGLWCSKEWVVENPGEGGIELVGMGEWAAPFAPRGGAWEFCQGLFELGIATETNSHSFLLDATPGFRLSIPAKMVKLRALIRISNAWLDLPLFSGLRYRHSWTMSRGNGSRGFGAPTFSDYIGAVAGGANSAKLQIPPGARSCNVQPYNTPTTSISLRQYSRTDAVTIVSTDPVTTRDIQVSANAGFYAVINGSGTRIDPTMVWNLFL